MPNISVKNFNSSLPGAPSLTSAAGAMNALLEACLVTGYGLTSLTSLSVAGGIATATVASGHPFAAEMVAAIAGSGTSALNGEQRVSAVTTNTFSFSAVGVADQTATGTITAKVAPLGWAKPFSSGNVAVFKSTDPASTGIHLRLDDSDTNCPRVRGYETMSDANTGTGPFPSFAMLDGAGAYWPKWSASRPSSGPSTWVLIGDERAFWIIVNSGANPYSGAGVFFGDALRDNTTDQFAGGLYCWNSDYNNYGAPYIPSSDIGNSKSLGQAMTNDVGYFNYVLCAPRDFNGLGTAVNNPVFPESSGVSDRSGASGSLSWPDAISGRLRVCRVMVCSNRAVRGIMPGVRFILNDISTVGLYQTKDIVSGFDGDLAGRKLMAARTGYNYTNSLNGSQTTFVDITGPWR